MYGREVMMIYHYTTIETLEKILSNKTIMFNCLLNVDDNEEGTSADYKSLARHIFVSCWTQESMENITLWNMYSKGFQGVRIGIESTAIKFIHSRKSSCLINLKGKKDTEQVIVFKEGHKELQQISYDRTEKTKFIEYDKWKHPILNFYNVAACKRIEWSPQKESRFILLAGETQNESNVGVIREIEKTALQNKKSENISPFSEGYFLDISGIDFSSFEVLFGPKLGEDEKNKCRDMINQYLPNCDVRIAESVLTGKMRK